MRTKIFKNRKDAGQKLGGLIKQECNEQNLLVLGIPRGGVEVAFYVAQALNAELSVLVSKKLPFPGQEELAFGAVSEGSQVFVSGLGKHLDPETISEVMDAQLDEVDRRVILYRKGKQIPDMKDRIVILVDDGIATGATFVPAIKYCKSKGAKKVVVASPVSGTKPVNEMYHLADDVIILEKPEYFFAVGQFYQDFTNLNDQQVMDFLKRYELHKG